jgi:ribonuclease HI
MDKIQIYTDGACSGNPGPGGLGAVIKVGTKRKEISEAYKVTTNNRMEILSAIRALEFVNKKFTEDNLEIQLYSDSQYLVNTFTKNWIMGWQRSNWKNGEVKNIDLWKKLLEVKKAYNIEWIWVKGHASNIENNRCDELATGSIKQGNFKVDEGYKK